jgi:hypothetical protein
MSVTINASQTSGLVMSSDLSGQLAFQNNGVSLPMGGVAPAFSAYQSVSQTFTSSTFTKIQLQTKEFDTNTNFDASTNYRFTPTVAGYYQINGQFNALASVSQTRIIAFIYKNGSTYKAGSDITVPTGGVATRSTVSSILYLNGSTDYVELYGYIVGTGTITGSTVIYDTYFNGCLVRGTP